MELFLADQTFAICSKLFTPEVPFSFSRFLSLFFFSFVQAVYPEQ
jgi:hypothetical protein